MDNNIQRKIIILYPELAQYMKRIEILFEETISDIKNLYFGMIEQKEI